MGVVSRHIYVQRICYPQPFASVSPCLIGHSEIQRSGSLVRDLAPHAEGVQSQSANIMDKSDHPDPRSPIADRSRFCLEQIVKIYESHIQERKEEGKMAGEIYL